MEPRGQVLTGLYLESSALAQLLLEHDLTLAALVADAPFRVASALSFLEVHRALIRSTLTKSIPGAAVADAAHALVEIRGITRTFLADGEILERARQVFPVEPVRSMDAIHLATMLALRESEAAFRVFTLDERVRQNAVALGFEVLP